MLCPTTGNLNWKDHSKHVADVVVFIHLNAI